MLKRANLKENFKGFFIHDFELEGALEDILSKEMGEVPFCQLGFCEDTYTDIVQVFDSNDNLTTYPLSELVTKIGNHFNMSVSNYSLGEFGELGFGFIFM